MSDTPIEQPMPDDVNQDTPLVQELPPDTNQDTPLDQEQPEAPGGKNCQFCGAKMPCPSHRSGG